MIYNVNFQRFIHLRPGQEYCEKCKGRGTVRILKRKMLRNEFTSLICSNCLGEGVIDWIEKAMGKKRSGESFQQKSRYVRVI